MNALRRKTIMRVRQNNDDDLVWEAYVSTGEKVKEVAKVMGTGVVLMAISMLVGKSAFGVNLGAGEKDFLIISLCMTGIWFIGAILLTQLVYAKGYHNRYGINARGIWAETNNEMSGSSLMQKAESFVVYLNKRAGYEYGDERIIKSGDRAVEWENIDEYDFDRMNLVISFKRWSLTIFKLYCTRDNYTQVLELVGRYAKKGSA